MPASRDATPDQPTVLSLFPDNLVTHVNNQGMASRMVESGHMPRMFQIDHLEYARDSYFMYLMYYRAPNVNNIIIGEFDSLSQAKTAAEAVRRFLVQDQNNIRVLEAIGEVYKAAYTPVTILEAMPWLFNK